MTDDLQIAPDVDPELLYVPLGGTGEIGMNLNLYGYGSEDGHRWLMVDCGMTFGDDTTPGVDIILPDPTFIAERADRLAGLVLTHGHEDHLGAIPYLWRRFRCPIYATPFTAALLRRKLTDAGLMAEVDLHVVPMSGRFSVGPFDLELITVTHSIPEPNSLVIRTPVGTAVHSGDWKFDPTPVIGETADVEALKRVGDEGVHAFICDSTNVFNPGPAKSEGDLLDSLTDLFARYSKKIAVSCFSTNVARLQTIARAAAANDRHVVLVGRSLRRIDETARETGYMVDIPAFVDENDAAYLPDDKAVLVCTGSQGESRAALTRIARGEHPHVKLRPGDVVVFSSRVIPGNERAIGRLQNRLAELGVEIVTSRDHNVHVSGHPSADEMDLMYDFIRPEIAIPQHGEARHLREHAQLAREKGVEQVVVIGDGDIVRLAPGPAEVVDTAETGRLTLEGNRITRLEGEILSGRKRALYNGHAVVSVVVDRNGKNLAEPQLTTQGLLDPDEDEDVIIDEKIVAAAIAAGKSLKLDGRRDDDVLNEAIRVAVRRTFRKTIGKRPVVRIHLVRVGERA